MRSEWRDLRLGDVSENISRRFDFSDKPKVVFINTGDVLEGKFLVNHYSDSDALPGQAKKAIKQDDILFTEIRPANKRFAYVDFNSEDYVVSTKFMVIKANELISPRYLYLVLTSNQVLREFQHVAESRSGTFPQITFDAVSYLPIKVPPLPIQKKIAHIFSTLDDKIELNRKMNETLEAMAQALFKSWFVDFDPVHVKVEAKSEPELEVAASALGISKEILDLFPSEFEESEMGMIPEGWKVKAIKDFGQVITGKTPSTKKKENYGVKYPFITIPDMHNQTFIAKTARYLSEEGHNVQSNKLIPKNSLMVSCIATVGLVSISSENSHTNQQINSIICSENNLYFLYCMLSSMTDKLIMYGGAGTATLNVNKNTFENIRVIKPVEILLGKFLELVKPIFEQILANTKETQTLQKTRDTLLPKLLSGELDVSNLDSLV